LKLSKSRRILLGILSIWPLVYIILFIIYAMVISEITSSNIPFIIMILLHILTILLSWALIIFYIVHALRTIKPPDDMRIIWVIILVVGNVIANPIYWYLRIWREREKEETAPTPSA